MTEENVQELSIFHLPRYNSCEITETSIRNSHTEINNQFSGTLMSKIFTIILLLVWNFSFSVIYYLFLVFYNTGFSFIGNAIILTIFLTDLFLSLIELSELKIYPDGILYNFIKYIEKNTTIVVIRNIMALLLCIFGLSREAFLHIFPYLYKL
ncbi:hypothetical protein EDEG_01416 [Edhazardia aedis USNM 41457]|uniref:Uncharacterized protein n=1 Tax=Edhazardia aedis (strain USNM 41457) TaxID=1003232 RepID=J9D9X9_EDHAE|nr:hypothetical protein EDEG_01416 [Edhazardia aedis USNM 41457]|eukprot:EJW04319.1 hypothetical protein EDEG_01416 [Edhazardia aedis USNM 41457]